MSLDYTHDEPLTLPLLPTQLSCGHATERWARMILVVVQSPYDPKTLDGWAHRLGASRGTIRTWCYAARQRPKASLDFARLLRAVVLAQGERWDLQELLDVVNARTVRALLVRAGFADVSPQGLPPSVDVFFERQRLIVRAAGVKLVRKLLLAPAASAPERTGRVPPIPPR